MKVDIVQVWEEWDTCYEIAVVVPEGKGEDWIKQEKKKQDNPPSFKCDTYEVEEDML